MNKRSLLFTAAAVYEVVRLCFILSIRTEGTLAVLPLSWYAAVPLFILPFFLLYAIKKNETGKIFAVHLYAVIKLAGIAGFLVFARQSLVQNGIFSANKVYLLKTLICLVPFFTIDVILLVSAMTKTYRQNKKTEGELCK